MHTTISETIDGCIETILDDNDQSIVKKIKLDDKLFNAFISLCGIYMSHFEQLLEDINCYDLKINFLDLITYLNIEEQKQILFNLNLLNSIEDFHDVSLSLYDVHNTHEEIIKSQK